MTSFRARDPDPNAVDSGRLLGLRIEAVSRGRFLRPYFVLLHRGATPSDLRVHRHTLPPCIPIEPLAARYLPTGGGGAQGLVGFARALRREVVAYHNRIGVIADMKRAVGISRGQGQEKRKEGEEEEGEDEKEEEETARGAGGAVRVVEIAPVDPEAYQVRVEWADGRIGRVVLGPDGRVEQAAVFKDGGGRDIEGTRLLGPRTAVVGSGEDDGCRDGDGEAEVVFAGVEKLLSRLRESVPAA